MLLSMAKTDPRVDAYIRKAAPFARPILTHLRAVVHTACPHVEETLKWGHPTFMYKGMLGGFASFTQHATFGFWKHALLVAEFPKIGKDAWGQFGRLTSVEDLPGEKTLARIVKAAAKLNDDGTKVARPKGPKKPPVKAPPDLVAALKKSTKAFATYEGFPESKKRDYVEWLTEAKMDTTRAKRLETAVAWMAEGKSRNWKYENC
jgi:uncharacterized protein YdeI (YjbR/CyaY-like superfamily)